MKTLKNIFAIAIVLTLPLIVSCNGGGGDDPAPDPMAEQLEALMNGNVSWSISSVTKDGYNVSDQFTNFVLTIGEFTYSTQNGLASAWPSSGTWEFQDNNANKVLRSDGTLINVSLSGTQLTLSFRVTGLSGGRIESVDGEYVFSLVSQ